MQGITRRDFLHAAAALAAGGVLRAKVAPAAGSDPFAKLDAVAHAELVRRREARPLDLVDAAIRRIERADPRLNAVVTRLFDEAREVAKTDLPDGPLRGVPFLVKDLHDLEGTRNTSGSRLFESTISRTTDGSVRSMLQAGAIPVGKSNVPELGLLPTTESLLFGPARNPWNLEHSPGGSSGGSAAAVASGMVPFAHASDGGGSIRIPASCCGLLGLKPSRGRVPTGHASGLVTELAVTRSVRDTATLLAACEDRSPGAPWPPVGRIDGPSRKRLRIAVSTTSVLGEEPDPDVARGIHETAELCRSLKHEIVPASPGADAEFADAFIMLWAGGPLDVVRLAERQGIDPARVLEPWTLGLADRLARTPPETIERAHAHLAAVGAKIDAFLARFDVWLTPVLRTPPPRVGEHAPSVPFETLLARVTHYVSYTPMHNVAGTPALSLPLGWSRDGLPIGSQLAARKGGEATLLALAYELEQAKPWKDRWPRLPGA